LPSPILTQVIDVNCLAEARRSAYKSPKWVMVDESNANAIIRKKSIEGRKIKQ
jgi:hypothetical protein